MVLWPLLPVGPLNLLREVPKMKWTACWQKFAVNDCLRQARQLRRSALAPLRQQDLRLNEQERLWRAEQRTQRLEGKQPENRVTP